MHFNARLFNHLLVNALDTVRAKKDSVEKRDSYLSSFQLTSFKSRRESVI